MSFIEASASAIEAAAGQERTGESGGEDCSWLAGDEEVVYGRSHRALLMLMVAATQCQGHRPATARRLWRLPLVVAT